MKTKIFTILILLFFQITSLNSANASPFNTNTALLQNQQHYPFFNANRMGRDVSVNWMFNNPILVVFFHVERSTDGVNFVPVAEIMPGSRFFFRYRDRSVTEGTYYYRVVAYQHDGEILYSRTDVLHIGRRC
jgi:hypothetical protein